jgi:hypothetical protein
VYGNPPLLRGIWLLGGCQQFADAGVGHEPSRGQAKDALLALVLPVYPAQLVIHATHTCCGDKKGKSTGSLIQWEASHICGHPPQSEVELELTLRPLPTITKEPCLYRTFLLALSFPQLVGELERQGWVTHRQAHLSQEGGVRLTVLVLRRWKTDPSGREMPLYAMWSPPKQQSLHVCIITPKRIQRHV